MIAPSRDYPVLITGVERVFLRPILRALTKDYSLLLVSQDQKTLENLDDMLKNKGKKVFLSCLSLEKYDAVKQLSKRILETWGGLKSFISATHFRTTLQPFRDVDTTIWKQHLEAHVLIPWRLMSTMEHLLSLCPNNPRVIFLQTSLLSKQHIVYRGVYRACCHALENNVTSWHAEVRSFVTVDFIHLPPCFGPLPGRRTEKPSQEHTQKLSAMLLSCLKDAHAEKGRSIHYKDHRYVAEDLFRP